MSIRYRTPSGGLATERTAGPDGGYLVVFPYTRGLQGTATIGTALSGGPIVTVRYRDGHTCSTADDHACQPVGYRAPPATRLAAAEVRAPIRVRVVPARPTATRATATQWCHATAGSRTDSRALGAHRLCWSPSASPHGCPSPTATPTTNSASATPSAPAAPSVGLEDPPMPTFVQVSASTCRTSTPSAAPDPSTGPSATCKPPGWQPRPSPAHHAPPPSSSAASPSTRPHPTSIHREVLVAPRSRRGRRRTGIREPGSVAAQLDQEATEN